VLGAMMAGRMWRESAGISRLARAQAAYDEACAAWRSRRGDRYAIADRESALAELEAAQAEHASKARVVGALMGAANAELEEDAS